MDLRNKTTSEFRTVFTVPWVSLIPRFHCTSIYCGVVGSFYVSAGETTDGLQIGTTPQVCRLAAPKALAELDPPRSLICIYGICNCHYSPDPAGFGRTSPKSGTDLGPNLEGSTRSAKALCRERLNRTKPLDMDERW